MDSQSGTVIWSEALKRSIGFIMLGMGFLVNQVTYATSLATVPVLSLDKARVADLALPPGRMHFSRTSHDFGRVHRGEVLEFSFSFENRGRGPLRIQGIHTSCGCTLVTLPDSESFEPGSSGEIKIKVDTIDYVGDFSRTIAVMTNEGQNRSHILTVKADIQTEIEVEPPIVDFGGVDGERGAKRTIRLTPSQSAKPLDIQSVEWNQELFDLNFIPDGDSWLVELALRPGLPTAFVRESLLIVNNSKHLSRLPVPIRADILGKIQYEPSYVEFGSIPSQGLAEKIINLSSKQDFQIKNIRAELIVNGEPIDNFKDYFEFAAAAKTDSQAQQALAVRLKNSDHLTGSVHGRLFVETSDPGQKEVAINFYAFFQE